MVKVIKLKSSDNEIFKVPEEVAKQSEMIKHMLEGSQVFILKLYSSSLHSGLGPQEHAANYVNELVRESNCAL